MSTSEAHDTPGPGRRLRADARRNEDRLLQAAAEAFATEGAGASVKDIARAAGVGVGTLYRRFPSKELLIEATYRQEVADLCDAAAGLAAARPPADALRAWMELFLDFMTAKQGMADALRVVLTDEVERLETRARLTAALSHLLSALSQSPARPRVADGARGHAAPAEAHGAPVGAHGARVEADGGGAGADGGSAEASDVLMALGGISLITASEQRPELATRLIDLLLHGILAR
ncbi:MAG TPA: helix-turn-helix domain-containing protein [Trebonia sp.]|nr:helix-turn-helix domain-containing protein [Trebonia sp.]